MNGLRLPLCALALLWLAGCATTPGGDAGGGAYYKDGGSPLRHAIDLDSVPAAVPKPEPLSTTGNPERYTVFGKTYRPLRNARHFTQTGVASWYGRAFNGKRTSSGETYDMYRMTAAHKTLPIPSYVRVTNLDNGRQVIVRVNDRGPFHPGRIIDLSYVAALKLGIVRFGSAPVRISTVTKTADNTHNTVPVMAQQPRVTRPQLQQPVVLTGSGGQSKGAVKTSASYLQAGAFSQPGNARSLRQRLQSLGIEGMETVEVISPDQAAGAMYRVRIGPFATSARRRAVQRQLQARGMTTISVAAHPD